MTDEPARESALNVEPSDHSKRSWAMSLLRASVLVPPLCTAVAIAIFGVPVPYFDQWEMTDLLVRESRGTATMADHLAQHTAHLVVVPRWVMVRLALVTGWDVRAEMWLGFLLAVLALAGAGVILRFHPMSERRRLVCLLISSLWLFSLMQWENWLWGWQLAWFLTSACVIWGAAALLMLPGWSGLLAAALLSLVASFSLAHGTLVWVTLLPLVLVTRSSRRTRVLGTLVWICLTLATLFVYSFMYRQVHVQLTGSIPSRLWDLAVYALALVGGLTSRHAGIAVATGTLTVVCSVLLVWRALRVRRDAASFASVSLAGFAFMFAMVTAWGRGSMGPGQALASRYSTTALLLIVGVVPLLIVGVERPRILRRTVILLLFLVPVIASLSVLPVMSQQARLREDARILLQAARFAPTEGGACVPGLYVRPSELRARAVRLHEAGVWRLPSRDANVRSLPASYEPAYLPDTGSLSLALPAGSGRTLFAISDGPDDEFADCAVADGGDRIDLSTARNREPRLWILDEAAGVFRQYRVD